MALIASETGRTLLVWLTMLQWW